jgi:hypothetical protein
MRCCADVLTRSGQVFRRQLDIAPGYPGRPLTAGEHEQRFRECIEHAPDLFASSEREQLATVLAKPQDLDDVRDLIALLVPQRPLQPA